MKKLLALVLALVMTMALAVTSNAAFKDDDKISDSCKEAVDVMNAVGVLIGDNNLNFNPTANLTRAEAAKIISYLMLGNKTAEALVGSNKFSDVAANNWAAGFIDYCAAEKIVNGMGDGTFNPAGQLTGFQFAKMLLGALGYDATIEGFTGTDWEISVSKVAEQAGLFDGLKISGRSVLTREQAAQMCLNTIKAPLVEYSNKGGNISINGAEINIGASKAEYVTTTLAQAQRISKRTLTNTLFTNKGGYTVEFGEKYYSNLYLTADNDAFGRPANTWTLGTKDIGTYTDASTLVLTYENESVKGKDVYSDIGYSAISDYDYEYYLDGVLMAAKENGKVTVKTADDFSKITKSNKDTVFGTGKGVLTQIFVDYDAETVLVVTINTYLAQATADYNAKTEKLPIVVYVGADNATTKTESYRLDVEDFAAIADLKEDDFVKVTKAGVDHQGKAYEIQSIEDVKVVSDVTVASYTTTKDDTVNAYYRLDTLNADGTKYDTSKKTFFDASKLYNYNNSLQQLKDATYNLYLDNYDNVLGIKEVKASDQYVFVVGYQFGSSVLAKAIDKALLITTEGEMKTANVKLDGNVTEVAQLKKDLGITGDDASVNKWVKYTLDEDGTYVIKSVAANQGRVKTDNTADNKAGVSAVYATLGTTNAAYGNAKSVYIAVKADTSVDTNGSIVDVNGVYTGIKNTNILTQKTVDMDGFKDKDGTGLNTFYLYNSNGYVTYAVIVGEDDTNSDNTVYFTSGATGRYYDAETKEYYVTYNAIQGGEQIVLKVLDDEATKVNPTIGGLYKATFNKDGYVKALDVKAETAKGDMNTSDNKAAGYTLTGGAKSTDAITLELKGATLWVKSVKAADNYVVIGDDCKIFVHTYNDDADEFVEYNTLESAIGALTTEKVNGQTVAYVNEVATICNKTTGYATTLIINEVKGTATVVKPSDPATKPEATIVGYTIRIPSVNGEPVDTVQGVLEKNGYKLETMQSATACVATKDGVTYFFEINTSDAYYTLTVNGKVVEYMAKDTASKISEKDFAAKYGTDGTAYKFVKDGTTSFFAYAPNSNAAMTNGTAAVEIETGYVEVKGGSLTGYKVEAPKYVKANSSFTVTVAKSDKSEISADTSITVNGTEKFGGKDVKELSFTVSAENKDVTVTVTASTTYAINNFEKKSWDAIGVSVSIDGPTGAVEGATVTMTATFSGKVKDNSDHTFTVKVNGSDANVEWLSTGAVTGVTKSGNVLSVPKTADFGTATTIQFSFKMPSSAVTITVV